MSVHSKPRRSYNRGAVALRRALFLFLALPASCAAAARAQPARSVAPAFDALARDAEQARGAGRLDEAARLYERALAARPDWADGLWAVGTVYYEQDRYADCQKAFTRLTALRPAAAPAWALRGLCEFRTGAHSAAGSHIAKALSLGLAPGEELGRAALYHQALVLVRRSQYDSAIEPLRTILQFQPATPELELACGLVLLRRPVLPASVPAADRGLLAAAGAAYCAHLARHPDDAVRRFRELIAAHPKQRYLRYGCGLALAQRGSPEALDLYREEAALFPDDVLARVELGFGLLGQGREKDAVAPAREAVRLAPGLFVTHLLLGRALAATGQVDEAVRELETAAAQQPRIPAIQLALARAYDTAGRPADAARARAAFQSLEAARRGPAGGPAPPAERP